MVVTVSVAFVLCRVPALTMYVAGYFSPSRDYRDVLHILSVTLVTINSAINPFIYAFVNQRFRQHIKELMCCVGACRNNVTEVSPGITGAQGGNRNTTPAQIMELQQVSQVDLLP